MKFKTLEKEAMFRYRKAKYQCINGEFETEDSGMINFLNKNANFTQVEELRKVDDPEAKKPKPKETAENVSDAPDKKVKTKKAE